ncbi:glycosyltransferase family 4 protein [Acinetobacter baumannii]|uniref:glycosyltransferase family 4 protein n=1 Tax=Acinetobacter baumannii TaxID=470 RepID=UPI0022EB54EF|nr:glycosyltransferase family 4 protein [Acinetobacter baumannii]MDA3469575.1 glycosyltransferase family 4 protein [Acinetobacter baumannii]MDA3474128.1 glycosyltransferase family 4 protein [Acinetobacter baumannii]MDN8184878.1 glycosyltransferase family 4 protein [Acinetobacter baumannii]
MKNICFLIGNLNHSGGTERVTTLIANELVEKGYNIFILNLVSGTQPFFKLDNRIEVASLYPQAVSMKKHLIGTILKIRNYAKNNNIDTLIDVDSILSVFSVPALFGLKIKHICWEHFNFKVDLGSSFRRLGRRLAAHYCDYIVTLTERDKGFWQSAIKKRNAEIITIMNPSPYKDIVNIPKKENKIILAAGRLTYQKGFDLLLKIWGNIYRDYPDWRLLIVGEGEDRADLENFIQDNEIKNVQLPGRTQDIDSYYRQASIFCLSSRFEGLGMVLLEAQAYGLPIVSFDCDVGPSEIISDSLNGFLVKNNDTKAFEVKLRKLIDLSNDDYISFIKNTKLNYEKFSQEHIVEQWLLII